MMPSRPPNILLIFTDQQRGDTLGAVNPVIRTPVLDRLVAQGTHFTNAYTPAPVCVPARCSLIFGQYPTKTGCYENAYDMPEVSAERPTFMSSLADAGYIVHGSGKMHFTPDLCAGRGFTSRDVNEELAGPDIDAFQAGLIEQGYTDVTEPQGVRGEMYYIPQRSPLPAHLHNSHWVADRSIDFLRQRDRARPFLLWSSFIAPHPPLSPPAPWHKLYRAPAMPLPKRPPDGHSLWTFINRVQNRYKFRDAGIDDNLLRVMKAYYYAQISFIDYNVGRIIAELEAQGELEDTLVLYTSDHGEFLGDYDCFGKRSFLKSAANVPLIVRYPERFAAGRRVDAPASLVDIMPTFLAAADLAAPASLDGVDLTALAEQPTVRRAVFGHYQSGPATAYERGLYMALTPRWKYIYSAAENREFLFDHTVDPDEMRNRAETVGYLEQTRAMRGLMIEQLRTAGRTAVLDGDEWRVFSPPAFYTDPDAGFLLQDPAWAAEQMRIPGYTREDDMLAPEMNVRF
jgi:arylsulfatase